MGEKATCASVYYRLIDALVLMGPYLVSPLMVPPVQQGCTAENLFPVDICGEECVWARQHRKAIRQSNAQQHTVSMWVGVVPLQTRPIL